MHLEFGGITSIPEKLKVIPAVFFDLPEFDL
jgi:hypothetical protein